MFLRHKVRLWYNCVEDTYVVIVMSFSLTEISVQLVLVFVAVSGCLRMFVVLIVYDSWIRLLCMRMH